MSLSDMFVKNTKLPSARAGVKHADGFGLYLHLVPTGRYWRMNYRHLGKQKTLALGTYPDVSLAQARSRRDAARKLLAEGIDPSAAKRADKAAKLRAASNTFEVVAREWMEKTSANQSDINRDKIRRWLEKNVFPRIGKKPIDSITPPTVLEVIRPIEAREAVDTARRVLQVCGQVFRYAVAAGHIPQDPTRDLKGALGTAKATHLAAITEPKKLSTLLKSIEAFNGYRVTKLALKIAPHVFVRPGELRKAEWAEFDLDAALWTIPAVKMKMRADHLVPLSTQVVAYFTELKAISGNGGLCFPGIRTAERPISDNTINAALRGLGFDQTQHTAHGFRATARTILDEVLGERVDLIEHQLAHAVRDANGRAYNRTAHLPARRAMMQRWSDYLDDIAETKD